MTPKNHILSILAAATVLFVAGRANARRVRWQNVKGPVRALMTGVPKPVRALALSADGKLVVAGSQAGDVFLWALPSGKMIGKHKAGGAIWALALSPDGKTVAVSGEFNGVYLFQHSPGFRLRRKLNAGRGVLAVTYDPKGRLIATGGLDSRISVWKAGSGTLVRTLVGHTSWISTLRFSADGSTLYSGSWDSTVRAWKVSSGKLLWTNFSPKFAVNGLDLGPAGKRVVAGGDDRRLRFLRAADGRSIKNVGAGAVTDLAVIRRASVVAVANWRGRVRFFSAKDGRLLQLYRAHAGPVHCLALDRAEKVMATGGHHGAIKIWKIP